MMCRHHQCQCARAAELAALADATGDARWLAEAVKAHDRLVPCRLNTSRKSKAVPTERREPS